MKKQTVVAKFGGTSVADAAQFRKIRDIVLNSPDNLERRFIVVSAPGRRFPGDQKVTDLLLACYEKASAGKSFSADLEQIRMRYREITDGSWLDASPYGVVHRIASDGSEKGIGMFCLDWAYAQCGHLRIDTHGDNTVMQNLVKKAGFVHCGTIYVAEDNDPRLAYEKSDKTGM